MISKKTTFVEEESVYVENGANWTL